MSLLHKILRLILVQAFILTCLGPIPTVLANGLLGLPEPGEMLSLSPAFQPLLLKGIKVHPENPFKFDFILDLGKTGLHPGDKKLQAQSEQMVKYFMTAMTVPDKDLWVNLSPYEKDRLIEPSLGKTVMGRDMLAQDYLLKQLSASLLYPEKGLGKEFWDRVYTQAREKFGKTDIPVNTFNKIWIVADSADVFEHGQTAYVIKARLKVMLEEDYLALSKHHIPMSNTPSHTLSSQIIKQIILPEIEKEVNEGEHFATLRQIYYAMILASWYKTALKNALLNQIYSNKDKVNAGIKQSDAKANEMIFQRYLQAYKKGVFNYIKEDIDPQTKTPAPRKYFSGGLAINAAMATHIRHEIDPNAFKDSAMIELSGEMTLPDSFGQSSQIAHGVDMRFNYDDNEYKVLLAITEIKVLKAKILKALLFKVHPGQEDQLLTAIDLTGDQSKFEAIIEGAKSTQALFKRAIERILRTSNGNLQMLPEEIYNLLGSHADLPEYEGGHTPIAEPAAVEPVAIAPLPAVPLAPAEPPVRRTRRPALREAAPAPAPAPATSAPVEEPAAKEEKNPLMLNDKEEIIAFYRHSDVLSMNPHLEGKLPPEKYHTGMLFVAGLSAGFELPDGSKIKDINARLGQIFFSLPMPRRLQVLTQETVREENKIVRYIFRGYQNAKLVGLSVFDWDQSTQPGNLVYNKELSEQMSKQEIAGYETPEAVRKKFQGQITRPNEKIYAYYDRSSKQGFRGQAVLAPRFYSDHQFPDGKTTEEKLKNGALNEDSVRLHMPYKRYNLITQEDIKDATGIRMIFRGYTDGVLGQVSVFDWNNRKKIPVYNETLSDQYTQSETAPTPAAPAPAAPGRALVPAAPAADTAKLETPLLLTASAPRVIANQSTHSPVLSTGHLNQDYELPNLNNLRDLMQHNGLIAFSLHLGKKFARVSEIRFSSSKTKTIRYIVFIAYNHGGNVKRVSVFDWDVHKKNSLKYNREISETINMENPNAENVVPTVSRILNQAPLTTDERQKAAGVDFEFEGQVLAGPNKNRGSLPAAVIFKGSRMYLTSLGMQMTSYLNGMKKQTFPLHLGKDLQLITFQEIDNQIIFLGYRDGQLYSKAVFDVRDIRGRNFLVLNTHASYNLEGIRAVSPSAIAAASAPAPAAPAPRQIIDLKKVAAGLDVREIPQPFANIPQWRNVVLVLGEQPDADGNLKEDSPYADIKEYVDAAAPGFFHFIPVEDLEKTEAFLENHGHNVAFAIGDKDRAVELFGHSKDHPYPVIIRALVNKNSLEASLVLTLAETKRKDAPAGALRTFLETSDILFAKRLRAYLSTWSYPRTPGNETPYGETTVGTEAPAGTAAAAPEPEQEFIPARQGDRDTVLVFGPKPFYEEAQRVLKGYHLVPVKDMDAASDFAGRIGGKIAFILVHAEQTPDISSIYYRLKSTSYLKALAPIFVAHTNTSLNKIGLIMKQGSINKEDQDAITLLDTNMRDGLSTMERVIREWSYETHYNLFPAVGKPAAPIAPSPASAVTPERINGRRLIIAIGENGILDRNDRAYFESLGYEIKQYPNWSPSVSDSVLKRLSDIAIVLLDTGKGRTAYYTFKSLTEKTINKVPVSFQFPFMINTSFRAYDHNKKSGDRDEMVKQEKGARHGAKVTLYSTERIASRTENSTLREQINYALKTYFDVGDPAMLDKGGIDLRNFHMNRIMVGRGVTFKLDRAMLARFKSQDFQGFDFNVEAIRPMTNLAGFLGLK